MFFTFLEPLRVGLTIHIDTTSSAVAGFAGMSAAEKLKLVQAVGSRTVHPPAGNWPEAVSYANMSTLPPEGTHHSTRSRATALRGAVTVPLVLNRGE